MAESGLTYEQLKLLHDMGKCEARCTFCYEEFQNQDRVNQYLDEIGVDTHDQEKPQC